MGNAIGNPKWAYLEYLKWVIEILALIIAGLWALKLYRETEILAQKKRASIVGELKWSPKAADECLAEYTVTFKNVGKTSIELARPTLNVWLAQLPNTTTVAKYLDPRELMRGEPIETVKLTNREFSNHYAPEVGDTVTSVVIVKRNPGRILMFSLAFPPAHANDPDWLDYRWHYACGESGEKEQIDEHEKAPDSNRVGVIDRGCSSGHHGKNKLAQSEKRHRVVFELTSDNPEQWEATLNNVENLQKAFGKEHTELEVVAHGKGLQALKKRNTTSSERITSISKTGVRFAACENTMTKMHLTKEDLLPVSQPVDSGVAEVVRKQEAGWAYLKASP